MSAERVTLSLTLPPFTWTAFTHDFNGVRQGTMTMYGTYLSATVRPQIS